jgi:hypothetical protein
LLKRLYTLFDLDFVGITFTITLISFLKIILLFKHNKLIYNRYLFNQNVVIIIKTNLTKLFIFIFIFSKELNLNGLLYNRNGLYIHGLSKKMD